MAPTISRHTTINTKHWPILYLLTILSVWSISIIKLGSSSSNLAKTMFSSAKNQQAPPTTPPNSPQASLDFTPTTLYLHHFSTSPTSSPSLTDNSLQDHYQQHQGLWKMWSSSTPKPQPPLHQHPIVPVMALNLFQGFTRLWMKRSFNIKLYISRSEWEEVQRRLLPIHPVPNLRTNHYPNPCPNSGISQPSPTVPTTWNIHRGSSWWSKSIISSPPPPQPVKWWHYQLLRSLLSLHNSPVMTIDSYLWYLAQPCQGTVISTDCGPQLFNSTLHQPNPEQLRSPHWYWWICTYTTRLFSMVYQYQTSQWIQMGQNGPTSINLNFSWTVVLLITVLITAIRFSTSVSVCYKIINMGFPEWAISWTKWNFIKLGSHKPTVHCPSITSNRRYYTHHHQLQQV